MEVKLNPKHLEDPAFNAALVLYLNNNLFDDNTFEEDEIEIYYDYCDKRVRNRPIYNEVAFLINFNYIQYGSVEDGNQEEYYVPESGPFYGCETFEVDDDLIFDIVRILDSEDSYLLTRDIAAVYFAFAYLAKRGDDEEKIIKSIEYYLNLPHEMVKDAYFFLKKYHFLPFDLEEKWDLDKVYKFALAKAKEYEGTSNAEDFLTLAKHIELNE